MKVCHCKTANKSSCLKCNNIALSYIGGSKFTHTRVGNAVRSNPRAHHVFPFHGLSWFESDILRTSPIVVILKYFSIIYMGYQVLISVDLQNQILSKVCSHNLGWLYFILTENWILLASRTILLNLAILVDLWIKFCHQHGKTHALSRFSLLMI